MTHHISDDESAWNAWLSTDPIRPCRSSFMAGRMYGRADARVLIAHIITLGRRMNQPHAEQGYAPVSPCARRTVYGTLACAACAAAEELREIERVWRTNIVTPQAAPQVEGRKP